MSYQVLALKWRPKQFKDAIGQEAITKTLTNSIINDKVGHAYLLTGTRGIGKTTIARIFAKAIRCKNRNEKAEPCLVCENCLSIDNGQSLDFIEIDGASNNSVDDVRDLIDNVQYLPTSGEYKVYIIDEIHMLSVNAFNALLKTLEEPPKHVVFIFATTDPQKLLGTVLSRCLRFDFRNAKEEDLVKHLEHIASVEQIEFESSVIPKVLAKQANGSFRDALSLFDQVISLSSGDVITEETLYSSLGMASTRSVNKMIEALFAKNKQEVIDTFNSVISENVDFKNYSIQILDKLFELINGLGTNQEIDFNADALEKISLPELLWIYENLFKDFDWSHNSIQPQKATLFVLVKTSLREMILSESHAPIEVKKKELTQTTVDPPVAKPKEPTKKITWENFIKLTYKENRALALNVERGNLLNKASLGKKDVTLRLGFSDDCKIFYDFLNDHQTSKNLHDLLAKYLELKPSDFGIQLEIVDAETREKNNFRSSVDIVKENLDQADESIREDIRTNKYILEAQKLFDSKIDKIILKKDS